jgi:hypothetical protein
LDQKVENAQDADKAISSLLVGEGGVFRIDVSMLVTLRDAIYKRDASFFEGAEVALTGHLAMVWMPKRPTAILEVVSDKRVTLAEIRIIPGIARVVGESPADTSVRTFWKEEFLARANLVAWIVVVLAITAIALTEGTSAIRSISTALAVYFAVSVPVLPLFFRPAADLDPVPFFRSGRLARWQRAESQLFRVGALGLAAALTLQAVEPPARTQDVGFVAYWLATVLTTSAATWLLLMLTRYAIPLVHAIDTAKASRAYLDWRRKAP